MPQTPDEIIFDRRRKRLMVQVLPGGRVVLKAPLGTTKRQINSFLEQHSAWIAEKRALMARQPAQSQAIRFVEGELLWLEGRQYPLHLAGSGARGLVLKQVKALFWQPPSKAKGRNGWNRSTARQPAKRLRFFVNDTRKNGVCRSGQSA